MFANKICPKNEKLYIFEKHRWPISKTTEINTETQELILKYYKLPDQHLKTAY